MKNFKILLFLFVVACSNDNNIVQRLAQEPAIVREVKGANNLFVLDLQNANSGLCSSYIVPNTTLPADYKKDGLPVFISGDVTSNFVAVDGYISENDGNTITLNGKYNKVELTTMNVKDYPFEVLFTEYSLVGISCQGKSFESNKVIVINSNEDWENYITCSDGSYPEFDFTKYTLLLAGGKGTSGIAALEKQFKQISASEYSLYVDITRNAAAIPQGWGISIKVQKLPLNAVVTINVNDHY